jgi:hypothetical protein
MHQRLIIVWIFANVSFKTLNAFFLFTVLSLFQYIRVIQNSSLNPDAINFAYNLTLRTMVTITDMLNLTAILHLYYYQGKM